MSSRARMVLGGVGAGLAALALIGDLVFLVVHDEVRLHIDVHVVLGLAGLILGFAVLGLSLALLLHGMGERRAADHQAGRDRDDADNGEPQPAPPEQERIDGGR